jgi:hypothetical protein
LESYRAQLAECENLDVETLRAFATSMAKKQDAVSVVPLGSLDEQLERMSGWQLAMLGSPGFESDAKIVRFFNSVQRLDPGFRFSVIGTNGRKTNFHLMKGSIPRTQESEQFMKLVRSICAGVHLPQRAYLQLSQSAVLIELLKGCLPLLELVTLYNKTQGRPMDSGLISTAQSYDSFAMPERIRRVASDVDDGTEQSLARAILVTSNGAMTYLRRTSNFARSMGHLSWISYLFGSMDTSLLAILIDKTTGSVTCSRFRITGARQPVPFRLTRMIVAAFGTCGVEGPFRTALTAGLKRIRRKARALASVLQFAVGKETYEPREIPKRYGEPFLEQEREDGEIDEVYERLVGEGMELERHVDALVEQARSPENLAEMPTSWLPWW